MQMLDERLAKLNITPNNRVIRKLMEAYDSSNKEELYTKIGAGIVSLDSLEKIVKTNSKSKILKFWTLFIKDKNEETDDNSATEEKKSDRKEGGEAPDFVIADCCKPIPGDSVVGFKDPITHQIIVHKSSCDELNRLASQHGECIMKEEIQWSQHNVVTNDFSINMREVNIQSHDGIFEGTLSLYVRDANSLNAVLERLRRIKGMDSVKRVIN